LTFFVSVLSSPILFQYHRLLSIIGFDSGISAEEFVNTTTILPFILDDNGFNTDYRAPLDNGRLSLDLKFKSVVDKTVNVYALLIHNAILTSDINTVYNVENGAE